MKAAARRQMDFERTTEKKIQKELDAEGDLFSDKEVFVTSAYKKKIEERQKIEEEERRQEQIESLLDVRKQKNLSGFYTSMLRMRTGEFVIEEESEKEKRLKEEEQKLNKEEAEKKLKPSRQYRSKRDESSEDEEEEKKEEEKKVAESNLDKDEQSSDNVPKLDEPSAKKIKIEPQEEVQIKQEEIEPEKKISKEEKLEMRRKYLFTKRTVGEKFDAELADYFRRKSTQLIHKSYIERDS